MDAHDWNDRYAASDLVWSVEPNQFVAAECAQMAPGTALDMAAGEGRNAIWLARRGWAVTAVDFAAAGLDKGRQLAADLPIEWVCADVLIYRPAAPVDLVVQAYLQLPADQRRVAVRNGWAALAPGGTLLIVAHDSSNLTDGVGGPQNPDVLMTADDLLGDLDGLAVEVVRAERVARTVAADDGHGGHTDNAGRVAWDCLVRVRKT